MFDFQKLTVYQKAKQFHVACKILILENNLDYYVKNQLGRTMHPPLIKSLFSWLDFTYIRYALLLDCILIYTGIFAQTDPDANLTFTLSGHIENSGIDTFRVIQDHPVDRIKVPVDANGRFHRKIPLRYSRFVTLDLPVNKRLYAEPGDQIKIVIRNGGLTTAYPILEGDRVNENNLVGGGEE